MCADVSEHYAILIGRMNKETYEDRTECSEMSAHKIQTSGNQLKQWIKQIILIFFPETFQGHDGRLGLMKAWHRLEHETYWFVFLSLYCQSSWTWDWVTSEERERRNPWKSLWKIISLRNLIFCYLQENIATHYCIFMTMYKHLRWCISGAIWWSHKTIVVVREGIISVFKGGSR